MTSNTPFVEKTDLWVSGRDGYHTYRIPALLTTRSGVVLAFCEGRRDSASDWGQIDLLVRHSNDGGRTWSDPRILASQPGTTCGNPSPIVDRRSGTVVLLFSKNPADASHEAICDGRAQRTIWLITSIDNGLTWSPPRDITPHVKKPGWTWYATGPGHGIQLESGRLVIPCDHVQYREGKRQDPGFSHVIFSDDGGQTWRVGGSADEGTNESTAVQTTDGCLYLNCRTRQHLPDGGNFRAVAWSCDDGESFCPIVHDAALPEPICQASVCRFTDERHHDRNRVLFSNPASRTARVRLTIRLSYDECRTWPVSRVLHDGPSAYSDLAVTHDMEILCLYECGERSAYERIRLARLSLTWLTDGADWIKT